MNYFWSIVLVSLLLVGSVVLIFTAFQVHDQQASLVSDLEYKTRVLVDTFKENAEPLLSTNSIESLKSYAAKFVSKQGLDGLLVFDKDGQPVLSSGLPEDSVNNKIVEQVISSGKPKGVFVTQNSGKIYEYFDILQKDDVVTGVIVLSEKASYIDTAILKIWRTNLLRLLIQILVFVVALALIVRWVVFLIIKSMKMVRAGKTEQELDAIKEQSFSKPLFKEISKIYNSLRQARLAASEEAKMRMEKLDTPWTEERLKEFVKAYLKDQKIFLVYNREPYSHKKGPNGVYYFSPAGGVLTALEPLMQACEGMWIAHGSGDADKQTADAEGKLQVPPDDPKYTLKRVWLTKEEVRGFNKGYSAEGLYPLCFNTHTRPVFKEADWIEYKKVNGKFARALLSEIKNISRPIIIVNEYHFTLLPQMIKKARPDARVGIFWHTPWPSVEAFSICPQRKEILEGMLGADIIGFHNQQFCNNFIDTVGKNVESIIDFGKFSITQDGHISYVRSFPVGVSFINGDSDERSLEQGKKILERLGVKSKYIGLGVDRLDYVKGIPERLRGIEYFFEKHPEYKGQFTFLQIASPCRTDLEKYLEYKEIVIQETERINKKFAFGDWRPIVLEMTQYSHEDLRLLYKLANVCVITSLHDGMNLVSKEFVAARDDARGALILSEFAGAAHDLRGALIINPYSVKQISDAIHTGLNMPLLEQSRRMKIMRSNVKSYNIYRWAAELLRAIAEF